MNKNMITLFFLVMLVAAGYYCYDQGFFNKEVVQAEKILVEICDPAHDDCSAIEEDLEA